MGKRRPRVFMGLTEVSSYYTNLKRGFDALGVASDFVDFGRHPFAFDAPPHWATQAMERLWGGYEKRSGAGFLVRRALSAVLRVVLLTTAIVKYDVFVFGYLTTFFRYRELPLLKRLGKKIVYVFHGSDSRPPYADGYQVDSMDLPEMIRATREKKAAIRTIERWADVIVCTPIHTQLHERPVVKYQSLGLPIIHVPPPPADARRDANAPVRIVHAPSNPHRKGTHAIRAAIESLSRRHDLEYIELIGRRHAEVIAELQRCDFVVDQLNGEGPCGGLATEAAALGKPAVVGTHTDDIWRMFAPDELPPVMRCDNDEVEAAIERLIVDRNLRLDLGTRACAFVRRFWDAGEVARRFLRVLDGDVPAGWMYDPHELRYVYGAGFTARELRETLDRYLAAGGVEALQLDDKPQLAGELVAYARGEAA